MKFKGTLVSFSLNMADYRKRLHEHLSDEIAQLAFVWLNAVLEEIPTWSGASRATFLQLASKIGYILAINPVASSRMSFGAAHGQGKITANPSTGIYTFTYSTDLKWLVSNEFNHNTPANDPSVLYGLKKPGPYHFQQKGLAAFRQASKDVRLPSPWQSIKKETHRV